MSDEQREDHEAPSPAEIAAAFPEAIQSIWGDLADQTYVYDPNGAPAMDAIADGLNLAFPGVNRGYVVFREAGEVKRVSTGALLVDPDGGAQFMADDGSCALTIDPPPED